MKKYRLGIIVDNPTRDLDGIALLSYELSNNGIECFLIPMNLARQEIWALDIDFLLLNYVRANNSNFIKKIINANIDFGVLDTEGGVLKIDDLLKSMDKNSSIASSLYCSWGRYQAKILADEGYYKKENIFITNNPRFDFYHKSFIKNELYKLPTEFLESKYILINTAFTVFNSKFKSLEVEKRMYKKYFGYDDEKFFKRYNSEKESVEYLIEFAKKLFNRFDDIKLIIRPHPFEDLKIYQDKLASYDRIHVTHEGTVVKWIAGAQALINYNCSTSYEAGLLKTPSFFQYILVTIYH